MYSHLLDGIVAALAAAFPGDEIYGDGVRQNFRRPAQIVAAQEVSFGWELGDGFYADYQVRVAYYPEADWEKKGASLSLHLHDRGLALFAALSRISLREGAFDGRRLRYRIGDDQVLYFEATYRLYGYTASDETGAAMMARVEIDKGVRQ